MIFEKDRLAVGRERYSLKNAKVFREEDHPRDESGKFGEGGGKEPSGEKKKKEPPKKGSNKPAGVFSDFIKHMINVDLSGKVEETKQRGVATLYTDEIDLNTLVDISRFSRQYKKYKVIAGGRNRLSIIFPESKFWDTHSFDWQPSR